MEKDKSSKGIREVGEVFVNYVTDHNQYESYIFTGLMVYLMMFANSLRMSGVSVVYSLGVLYFASILVYGLQYRAMEHQSGDSYGDDEYSPFYLSWLSNVGEKGKTLDVLVLALIQSLVPVFFSYNLLIMAIVSVMVYMVTGSMFCRIVKSNMSIKESFDEVSGELGDILSLHVNYFKHMFIGIIVITILHFYISSKGTKDIFVSLFYLGAMMAFMNDLMLLIVLPVYVND